MPSIGRNAPCPCQSGQKYKKCCLPKAPVEPAAVSRPGRRDQRLRGDTSLQLRRIMELLSAQDTSGLVAALGPLGELLRSRPTLASIRFPEPMFRVTLVEELSALGDAPLSAEDTSTVLGRVLARLPAADVQGRLRRALESEAADPALVESERMALFTGAFLLRVEEKQAVGPETLGPVTELLAKVQAGDAIRTREHLVRAVSGTAERVFRGELPLEALPSTVRDDAIALLESSPELVEHLQAQSQAALKEVVRDLMGPNPPAIFLLDELLWIGREIGSRVDPTLDASRNDVVDRLVDAADEVCDEAFVTEVTTRLLSTPGKQAVAARFALAFQASPGLVAIAAMKSNRHVSRGPDERAIVGDGSGLDAERLDAWSTWLEGTGRHAAAARVRGLRGTREEA